MLLSADYSVEKIWKSTPDSFSVTIDSRVQQSWRSSLESLEISSIDHAYKVLLANAPQIAKEHLPADLLQKIVSIKQPSAHPFRVLKNLPFDPELQRVPTDGKRPSWKTSWVSEGLLIGIAGALQLEPLSYIQEKEGMLVHEVVPISGQEHQLSNAGKVALGFHTDHAILDRCYRPEYLMLTGLVNSCRTPTLIACLDDALDQLEPRYEDVLRQPKFRIEMPDSVSVWNGRKILSEWKPLLTTGSTGKAEFAGNLHSVRAMDKEANQAIKAFVNVLRLVVLEIVLEPGVLVLFDNHRCLHARRNVKGERWLQRMFCRHSLDDLRQVKSAVTTSRHTFDMKPILL